MVNGDLIDGVNDWNFTLAGISISNILVERQKQVDYNNVKGISFFFEDVNGLGNILMPPYSMDPKPLLSVLPDYKNREYPDYFVEQGYKWPDFEREIRDSAKQLSSELYRDLAMIQNIKEADRLTELR